MIVTTVKNPCTSGNSDFEKKRKVHPDEHGFNNPIDYP